MKLPSVTCDAVKHIDGKRVLVFASHPGDEIFGCGGAILCHLTAKIAVRVAIVSDGGLSADEEKCAESVRLRQNESITAAEFLGYGEPDFWMERDEAIRYGEKLVCRVLEAIQHAEADLVYAPSVFETSPERRALGMAVMEAVRRCGAGVRLALYEVGAPLSPNLLLDLSAFVERKKTAMECFASSPNWLRHGHHIAALNRYRSYDQPAEVTAAEAYLLVSGEELAFDPLNLYRTEHDRQQVIGLSPDNRDMPLVYIITRSKDRPMLTDSLESIALQT